jgi:uncharacterized YccA/Bax inhibitor family protein
MIAALEGRHRTLAREGVIGDHSGMRTANPLLNEKTFPPPLPGAARWGATAGTMTIGGTVNKCFFLVVLAMLTSAVPLTAYWRTIPEGGGIGSPAVVMPWMIAGALGGLLTAFVLAFKVTWAPFLAPAYALLEGLFLGGISVLFEARFAGIVLQAVFLTVGTLVALLLAYRAKLIRVTENFRLGVFAATGGIALIYLATFVLGLFGVSIPYIHQSGIVGIGFSLFVVVIASLNLVLDFDFIERGAEAGAPKHMEWFAAFGLMVTLVWLYVEFLRLLSKLRSRD